MLLALQILIAGQEAAPQPGPGLGSFLPMLLIMGILFYLLIIRPTSRQNKERQALLAALKKNDKVITSGGIIGVVAGIKEKEDEVMLKVDESSNVRLRVTRSSIVRVIREEEAPKEQKEGAA